MSRQEKTRVLVVEDDVEVMQTLQETLGHYDKIECICAKDAGEAIRELKKKAPAAVVLDVMMAYVDVRDELDPEGIDSAELETGIRILEWIRDTDWGKHLYVAVVTARAHPSALEEIERRLQGNGRLYLKPFDTLRFEHELAGALGLESKVPQALQPRSNEDDEDEQR